MGMGLIGGGKSKPPAAPDPNAVASAQSTYDKNTAGYNAALNRYDVTSPYGSLTWTNTGTDPTTGAPLYAQQVNLNPTAQATLGQTQSNAYGLAQTQGQMLANAAGQMAAPMDFSRMPGLETNSGYHGPALADSVTDNGPGYATSASSGGPGYATSVTDRGPGYATGVADRGPGYAGPVAQGDLTGLANKATQASYDSSMALVRPQMDIDRKAAVQDLANRGIPVGSEAYNNIMGSLDRSQDFTQTQAANNATLSGMQYQNQLFNQGQANANLQNLAQQGMFQQGTTNANLQNAAQQGMYGQGLNDANLRNSVEQNMFGQAVTNAGLRNTAQQNMFQQGLANANLHNAAGQQGFDQRLAETNLNNSAQATAMQQMLALRNQPLNEYNAMMTGTQVQAPQFQATPTITAAAPNYAQAAQNAYQGQLNAYNAQTQQQNSMMSGLMNLGGSYMMAAAMSDRRLKSNVVRIGTHPLGIGVYEYDIFGERQRGVMADEVEKVMPEAVLQHPSGYKMVNYARL